MDMKHVIDVPDTPERVQMQHRDVGEASHASVACGLEGSDSTAEGMQSKVAGRNHIISEYRQNGNLHNLHNRDIGTSDRMGIERDFVASVSKNATSENAPLFRKVDNESFKPDRSHHLSSQRMDDRKNMRFKYSSKPSDRVERCICPHREQNMHHKVFHEPSYQCAEEDRRSPKFRMDSPLVIGSSLSSIRHPPKVIHGSNKGKEKINDHMPICNDLSPGKHSNSFGDGNPKQKDSVSVSAPVTSSRFNGRKRLVRNGCISSHNIAKEKQLDESSRNSRRNETLTATNSKASVGPGHVIDIDGGINHGSSNQLKGNEVVVHPCSSREHGAKSQGFSNRANMSKRQKKLVISSHQGNDGDVVCIGSRGESSSSKLKTNDGSSVLNTVIEVNELSPEVRQGNSANAHDLEARARQVEVDEMLARELQEQLYHEMPDIGMGERDSQLAWRLQYEENVAHAPLNRNDHVNLSGRSLLARRQNRSQLLRNQPRRGRTRAGDTTSRLARLRNQIHNRTSGLFPSHMDLDMRIDLLEALEAVVDDDIRSVTQLLDSDRELNENDYEMLLTLDENNHEHLGASTRQISNLPETTVQTENYDACSICLETPAVGDTMRHLPCLHKFHKVCIDRWLRRKRSCPVCKSDIA